MEPSPQRRMEPTQKTAQPSKLSLDDFETRLREIYQSPSARRVSISPEQAQDLMNEIGAIRSKVVLLENGLDLLIAEFKTARALIKAKLGMEC